MKVAQSLIHAGWVEGVRGRRGGLRLAVDPASIRIGDVVRQLEGDQNIVPCLDAERASCVFAGACKLTGLLGRAAAAFTAELDRTTLADLAAPDCRVRLSAASAPAVSTSRRNSRSVPLSSRCLERTWNRNDLIGQNTHAEQLKRRRPGDESKHRRK